MEASSRRFLQSASSRLDLTDGGLSAAGWFPRGGLDESDHERVRLSILGAPLRLEKRPDEERVLRNLEDAGVAAVSESREFQPVLFEQLVVVGIQLEIAEILFVDSIRLEDLARAGVFADVNALRGTGELGASVRLVGYRARHRVNQQLLRLRSVLSVLEVRPAEHVLREFEQGVLKTGARRERRRLALATVADRSQRARAALVRTTRGDPDAVEIGELGFGVLGRDRVGSDPGHLHWNTERRRGVLDRSSVCRVRHRF